MLEDVEGLLVVLLVLDEVLALWLLVTGALEAEDWLLVVTGALEAEDWLLVVTGALEAED